MNRIGNRSSPMNQEVPAPLVDLLKQVQKRMRENAEHASKLSNEKPKDASKVAEQIADTQHVAQTVKANSMNAAREASGYLERLHTDQQMCCSLDRIHKDANALRPAAAKELLNDLLSSAGNKMQLQMERLAEKVAVLETPISSYQNMANGLEAPKGITKQELFEHVNRTVSICDNLFMSATGLHDHVDAYTKHL